MDNSHFGTPSKEWVEFGAAHPDLDIDNDGFHDEEDYGPPSTLKEFVNKAREKVAKEQVEKEGLAEKVTTQDYSIPTSDGSSINLRRYLPVSAGDSAQAPAPAYLYLHGGGLLIGSIDGESYSCYRWAHRSAGFANQYVVILHVCYRHTPEFTYPRQHDDAWDAFQWIQANAATLGVDPTRIIIGGASAGAHLTSSVVFRELELARQEGGRKPRIAGQHLVVPWLIQRDLYPLHLFSSPEKSSLVQCVNSPTLPKIRYDVFTDLCKIGDVADRHANAGLATEEELKGTPKTVIIVAGRDLLRDEAFIYAAKLEKLGIPIKKHIFSGLPHAFRRHADLPSSKRWDDLTPESIRWLLDDSAKGHAPGEWTVEIPEQYR